MIHKLYHQINPSLSLLKIFLFLTFFNFISEATAQYIEPLAQDTTTFGMKIQRSFELMATSTPQLRKTVKVLVYGQSISKQSWSDSVRVHLLKRFPHADLIIENRAIGGFASQLLVNPVRFDVPSFYPDLVLFHVYGSQFTYDSIINYIRRETAAEVALQNDHYTGPDSFSDYMSFTKEPQLADSYQCEMMNIRTPWEAYDSLNHIVPKDLTIDGTHLNAQGNFLMSRLIERYLAYKPKFPSDPTKLVTTYEVGKDINFVNNVLTLPVNGNRIDIIPAQGAAAAIASVTIDGKNPSEFPGSYYFSRPNDSTLVPGYYSRPADGPTRIDWPWQVGSMTLITSSKPRVVENWVLTITSINSDKTTFTFDVEGSVTGKDGSGSSSADFFSKSGRVIIKKGDWFLSSSTIAIPVGYKIKWYVIPMFKDQVSYPSDFNLTDHTKENALTISQGIPNAAHTLRISSTSGTFPIKAIRVYRPYLNRGQDVTSDLGEQLSDMIKLYPDPASQNATLDLSVYKNQQASIQMLNILGTSLTNINKPVGAENITIDVSSLDSGIYFLNINAGGNMVRKKFSVSHK